MTANTTTTTANINNEALADFALQIFERARQLQHERSGLMSNSDSMEKASLEVAARAIADLRNLIEFTRLFGLDAANEQIKKKLIMQYEKKFAPDIKGGWEECTIAQKDSEQPIKTKKTKLVRETEIVAP